VANKLTRSSPRSNLPLAARQSGIADILRELASPPAVPQMYVDIVETDDAYILTADVPGADREDITVVVDGKNVSIRAEVEEEEVIPGRRTLVDERVYGQLSRSFTLPQEIDESRADATVTDGVLVLVLPKKTRNRVEVRQGKQQGKLARDQAAGQAGTAAGATAATGKPARDQAAGQTAGQTAGQAANQAANQAGTGAAAATGKPGQGAAPSGNGGAEPPV
jgi:HSP20 family protein